MLAAGELIYVYSFPPKAAQAGKPPYFAHKAVGAKAKPISCPLPVGQVKACCLAEVGFAHSANQLVVSACNGLCLCSQV